MKKLLFLGDIVGKVGRQSIIAKLSDLIKEYEPELVIANGENASGGAGIRPKEAKALYSAGIDVITLGNHAFDHSEVKELFVDEDCHIISPLNLPSDFLTKNSLVVEGRTGELIGVISLMAGVFMDGTKGNPFLQAEEEVDRIGKECNYLVIDFHGEATSEKIAFGHYLDGKVTLVVGTHTHVQTADERILEKGSAYITDVGMCGAYDSVIGFDSLQVIDKFVNNSNTNFGVAKGHGQINAVVVTLGEAPRALGIERINIEVRF